VLGVVALGQLARNLHELHGDEAQAAPLKAGDDLADETALHAVGLDKNQGAFQVCAS